jgi:murein L,D-transpeptidase YafK
MLLGIAAQADAQRPGTRDLVASGEASARAGLYVTDSAFARDQLQHSRVRAAMHAATSRIGRVFEAKGIAYPAEEIFLRVFKQEQVLELWVKPAADSRFRLIRTYEICALAGEPGPKRRQGDEQVPEGFYMIDLFNPMSAYHLSLRVDYPNQRDRIANRGRPMGGDIFIHGGCKSIGCIAVTDAGIQEIYWMAVEARSMGQEAIPVHIFPARPNSDASRGLISQWADEPATVEFWRSLEPAYQFFEHNRRVPQVSVDARGRYVVSEDVM